MENRLDTWLVANMGIKSRSKAQELIKGGFVLINGRPASKTGEKVSEKDIITLTENDVLKYVSRGGLKLDKAIREFGLDFKDKTILDIGSSTGGFTDCALKAGARKVIAVDVGTDIMDKGLRQDSRVELHENTDIRDFPYEEYSDTDYAVCDASFISLPVALSKLGGPDQNFTLIALIKPQFECGINAAKKYRGVVNNKELHFEILRSVLLSMQRLGFYVKNITFSPICGGDGNIEYISEFIKETKFSEPVLFDPDMGENRENLKSAVKGYGMTDTEISELIEKAFAFFKK